MASIIYSGFTEIQPIVSQGLSKFHYHSKRTQGIEQNARLSRRCGKLMVLTISLAKTKGVRLSHRLWSISCLRRR